MPNLAREAGAVQFVVGDFNATVWSAAFRGLLSRTGLRQASRGYGHVPTWPADRPYSFLGLPIDHALHSASAGVLRYERGPRLGSDHYPLLIDFSAADVEAPR